MTPQQIKLLEILEDGYPHCVSEILQKMRIVDYRKRLSELKKPPYNLNLKSESCRGICGLKHKANLHQWQWVKKESKHWWENNIYKSKHIIKQSTLL